MGYPNGVSLAVISGGTAFTAFGDDVPVQITVTPRFPKQGGGFLTRIIHAATGWVMTSDPDTFTAEAGTEVSFSVPHVDQAGFRDPAQNAYTGWYYEVKVVVGAARGRTKTAYTQTVAPIVGQALVDLDLVPEGQVGDPQSVAVPEVVSVNGMTGAVTIEAGGASDADIAAYVSDPNSTTRATVDSAIETSSKLGGSDVSPVAFQFGRKVMFLGDSHTDGAGATNVTFSFAPYAGRIAGTELVSVIRRGFAGETSSQIAARTPGLLDEDAPDVLFVMCGTNDAGQSVAPAAFASNLAAIKAEADARKIPLIVGYVPPRAASADAALHSRTMAYNHRIYRWATDAGIPVADTHMALVDPTTGALLGAYDSGDGVHFNNAGHLELAKSVAPSLVENSRRAPWPVRAKGLGLLPEPLNGNTGNPWDVWSNAGGATPTSFTYTSPVPGDGLTAGKWATIGYDNSGGTGYTSVIRAQTLDTAKFSEGDQLVAFFKLKTSGGASASGRWMRGTTSVSIPVDGIGVDVPYSGYITSPYTVTSSDLAGNFRLGFSISCPPGVNGTASMGQVDVFNLTTGSLVGLY